MSLSRNSNHRWRWRNNMNNNKIRMLICTKAKEMMSRRIQLLQRALYRITKTLRFQGRRQRHINKNKVIKQIIIHRCELVLLITWTWIKPMASPKQKHLCIQQSNQAAHCPCNNSLTCIQAWAHLVQMLIITCSKQRFVINQY